VSATFSFFEHGTSCTANGRGFRDGITNTGSFVCRITYDSVPDLVDFSETPVRDLGRCSCAYQLLPECDPQDVIFTDKMLSCRKLWFLVSDAWLFALLNVAEFVPRLNKDFFPSLLAFTVYDRVLAAASAVPLLLFMIFLLSFAKGDLLPILPIRYRSTLALILSLCIPLVTISTEIAALLGFSYSKLSLAFVVPQPDSAGRSILY